MRNLTFTDWVELVKIVFGLVGAIAAIAAVKVYWNNSRLEHAKWVASLYEKFYERKELKEVRDKLDCDANHAEVDALVTRRDADLADYLNFFQFIAYLKDSDQLTEEEIKYMFDYYLRCLKKHGVIRKYIKDNNFHKLDSLLERWL